MVGMFAYEFRLPCELASVHMIFHVSMLKCILLIMYLFSILNGFVWMITFPMIMFSVYFRSPSKEVEEQVCGLRKSLTEKLTW